MMLMVSETLLLDEHLQLAADWDHDVGEKHGYDSVERRRVVLSYYAGLPSGIMLLEHVRDTYPELHQIAVELLAERRSEPARE